MILRTGDGLRTLYFKKPYNFYMGYNVRYQITAGEIDGFLELYATVPDSLGQPVLTPSNNTS